MKMWSWRVIILLLFCYACIATDKRNKVWFYSKNFNNTVQWEPVAPAFPGEKVTYRVEHWNDVHYKPLTKEGCEDITALSCDLTVETPSLPDVHYWAQVWVNGHFHGKTHRFKPIEQTILGQPNISIYVSVTTLYVNANLPLGSNGVSIGDTINQSRRGPSEILATYTLNITDPAWAAQTKESITGKFAVNLTNNQTKFCGYVVYKTEWCRKGKSEKASFCFKLQDDPLKSLPWIILTAASLVAIVIFTAVFTCHYVKGMKPKHIPQALVGDSRASANVLQFPDNSLVISTINTQTERVVSPTLHIKAKSPSFGAGGYSPQDIPGHLWQDLSSSSLSTGALTPTPNLGDTSAQSVIYSTIGVCIPPVKTNCTQQLTTDGMTPLHNPDDWDSSATSPLLLHTVRDQDGNLVLPSLALQIPDTAGDTERKLPSSDFTEFKREGPSLASVQTLDDCSDSGCDDSTLSTPTLPYCNSHYFPPQPTVPDSVQGCETTSSMVETCESGYTHNWMPAIVFTAAGKTSCGYRNANYPWGWTGRNKEEGGEEEKDKGGEGRLTESLLGGWGLQFQE